MIFSNAQTTFPLLVVDFADLSNIFGKSSCFVELYLCADAC
ncbi:hypothetical protein HMPREF1583_00437 [Gardnerella vaginalis JCP8151B]|nr:hypothetical protein HMPREF1583_00437 [Gardnerella vaginalis JCP8151B]